MNNMLAREGNVKGQNGPFSFVGKNLWGNIGVIYGYGLALWTAGMLMWRIFESGAEWTPGDYFAFWVFILSLLTALVLIVRWSLNMALSNYKSKHWFSVLVREDDWEHRFSCFRQPNCIEILESSFPAERELRLIIKAQKKTPFHDFDLSFIEPRHPMKDWKRDFPRTSATNIAIAGPITRWGKNKKCLETAITINESEDGKAGVKLRLTEKAEIARTTAIFLKVPIRVFGPWDGQISFSAQAPDGETRHGRFPVQFTVSPSSPTSP